MGRLTLIVGLAAALFLLDPSWAMQRIESGLRAIGWGGGNVSLTRVARPDPARRPPSATPDY